MKRYLLLLLSLPLLLHARKGLVEPFQIENGPWFTGPLLTPSGHVVPVGHQNFEPTFYWTDTNGVYNNHWNYARSSPPFKVFLSQTVLQFGILPKTELNLVPEFNYNNSGGKHHWRISDQPFSIGIQILMDQPGKWYPAIKLRLGAHVPIGKYDRLDPTQLGTDAGGGGTWIPTIGFATSKLFHSADHRHHLSWRTSWSYHIPTPISVHGLNVYGGSPAIGPYKATQGTVYLGNVVILQQGFEYSLNLNWVLALDVQYRHVNKTRFSGHSPPGTKPISPSSEQFSLAPALEYNFNAEIGLIAGPWFSIAGRNTSGFISWVFGLNIYH